MAVLLAILVAMGWLQTRQYLLLNATNRYQDDYLVWSLFQFETEALKLRLSIEQYLNNEPSTDPDEVAQRYEIFVSRVNLIQDEYATRVLRGQADYQLTVQRIQAFVRWADALPLNAALVREQPQRLREALNRLDDLAEPMHELSLTASHFVATQVTERNAEVREHSLASLWLSALELGVVLLLGGFVLRQFKRLQAHSRQQEALVHSLHRAQTEAEAASHAKSAFLATMSHELRTPMHGLLGMLSLLRESKLDAQQKRQLQAAADSAQHLLSVLNDILDASKMEAGGVHIQAEPLCLSQLLQELNAQCQPQAQLKQLQLELHQADDVPGWVLADPTRLRQILLNLLGNAIKFSEQGRVSLHLSQQFDALGRDFLRFEVSDTGIGMDEATLGRLFKRFSQGEAGSARRYGGTGLGLEISRNLARAMGGDIVARSTLGEGSVFTVDVPLPVCEPMLGAVHPSHAQPLPLAGLRQLQILVAEDNPTNQAYLEGVLHKLGHKASFCGDGQQALAQAQCQHFDLILMDLHMPVIDGFEATRAIRELPAPQGQVRIIALSADAFADTRRRAIQAGMDDFLAKPLGMDELRRALSRQPWESVDPTPLPTKHPKVSASGAPETSSPSTPPELDTALIAELAEFLPHEKLTQIYQSFCDSLPNAERRLDAALRSQCLDTLRTLCHELKGTAANLGLLLLSRPAARLESATQTAQSPEEIAPQVQQLREALQRSKTLCAQQLLAG